MSSNPTPPLKNDVFLDSTLRPSSWDEYIGQEATKSNIHILLRAAAERGHPPEHLLFYGPPGLGKTTLAHVVAKELGTQIKSTSGPAIEKVGDLASVLTNLSPGDILFIDEVHRLQKTIEEILYSAMESGSLHIIIGKGPSARTLELDLPPFTLIAATTRIALLSAPLRSRFSGGIFRLEFYTLPEIKEIIKRSAGLLCVSLEDASLHAIAERSRFTPRTANYLLKRCRDYAQVHSSKKQKVPSDGFVFVDKDSAAKALSLLEIDEAGLSSLDRKIIETIISKFRGGPVGINTLGTALNEEEATIEEVNEPYLIQIGFLERTPRGRVATEKAYEHLKIRAPQRALM